VIIDMVCPLEEMRQIINPDLIIWVKTTIASKYADTDSIFEPPEYAHIEVFDFGYDIEPIIKRIKQHK
jgi:hypothetical protein